MSASNRRVLEQGTEPVTTPDEQVGTLRSSLSVCDRVNGRSALQSLFTGCTSVKPSPQSIKPVHERLLIWLHGTLCLLTINSN